jgi:hypothetical protein
MTSKIFIDLATPDERSLRFSSRGFSPSFLLTSESAADHIQRTVDVRLDEAVPQTMRDSFDRVRAAHIYGLFDYALFTAAGDLAVLALQQAFAERLVAYYSGVIPLVNQSGVDKPLAAARYEIVNDALLEKDGTHRRGDWFIKSLAQPGAKSPFRGGLGQLFSWARQERLLDGQRSKVFDRLLVKMRNRAAHPASYKLSMPTDSALTIRDVGEFINRLWGARTSGGRIFPEPVRREVMVLGWAPDGNSFIQQHPEQLIADESRRDWTYLIVLAAPDDELVAFHADFETLRFSAEWLWGPGTHDAAVTWLKSGNRGEDNFEHLDRWFLVRVNSGVVDPPRNPNQFAGLSFEQRDGEWHLICADYPADAFNHVRSVQAADTACSTLGECDRCWIDASMVGGWEVVSKRLKELKLTIAIQPPRNVRVGYKHADWEAWSAL